MNDGDQCPECESGTMFVLTASLDILRCSWCGHLEALDTVERPKRKDLEPIDLRQPSKTTAGPNNLIG